MKKIVFYCLEHTDEEIKLYCETCDQLICLKCAIKDGKHHNHEYSFISKAYDKIKEEIAASLQPAEERFEAVNATLSELNSHYEEICNQESFIEGNIENTIGQLHKCLDTRKAELMNMLHQMTREKLTVLSVQRNKLKIIQTQLSTSLDFVKRSLKANYQEVLLKMKKSIERDVKEMHSELQTGILKPNVEADMIYTVTPDLSARCLNFGKITTPAKVIASKCHATGKGLEIGVVGETCTAIMQAVDYRGDPFEEVVEKLHCELLSELTGVTIQGSVERIGQSQYEISYKPTVKGRHQLSIKVGDQHIKRSPFPVVVILLNTPILTLGSGLKGPWGVTVTTNGEVVVSEYDQHRISIFNPNGEKVRSFGMRGESYGQFKHPRGLAVDQEGNILVVDVNNHRIQKFTPEGEFLTAVGTRGNGPLRFCFPVAVAFSASKNKVYVADQNHHIQILNPDLTFSSMFGINGSGKGQFEYPCDVACDSAGKVYVADSENHRIQVFTATGRFLMLFGRCGKGREELNWPIGITIDANNILYISKNYNHRVSVFTSRGQFVTSFGEEGERPGELKSPRGLAVDKSGVLYVCDSMNKCIHVCTYLCM